MNKIKYKIAIISGKGGVGKTTITVNMACGLRMRGFKVGVIDADIHGPDIPIALGLEKACVQGSKNGMIPPQNSMGIKVMSIGFFIEKEEPVIWSGPLVSKAIIQFLRDVIWGDLDFLIIDLPPGTGDPILTIFRFLPNLTGVILVTTPQKIALIDAQKALNLCKKLNIPVLGVIENMSYFVCPFCGSRIRVFPNINIDEKIEEWKIPLLGRIPLINDITSLTDMGQPIIIQKNEISNLFMAIIDKLLIRINEITTGEN